MTAATSYEAEYNRAPSAERGEHRNNLLHRIDPNRALGKLAELGRFNGFTVYVTVNPNPKARQVLKNLWVLRERGDIKVLRLRKRLLKEIASRGLTGKDLVLPNDPHPSPVKHRLLGTLLADDLQRELGRAKLS